MAMLAEPRQKKRYNLVPKGKPLFEDGDRFGTKMLEKMGWSKGKGLGSREDGQQEFIRVRYKNDADGLGYEDRDDQWTQHEKHFNGLLESLNGGDPFVPEKCSKIDPKIGLGFQANVSKENLKDKFSGQSLEEKSKNSKARVHYKKFTKGKDMSQYSEKDLANIFGKKTTPGETNIYDQFQAFSTANDDEKLEGKEEEKEEVKNPFELGTQIINTGVSVSDYFKMKMAALKEKNARTLVNGNAGKARAENDLQDDTSSDTKETKKVQTEEDISQKKKKKKKKQIMEESEVEDTITPESGEENFPKKKTKKKRALEGESVTNCDLEITSQDTTPNEDALDEAPQKKKKKKKRATDALEDKADTTNEEHEPGNAIEERPCKKMKNKNTDTEKGGKHEETVLTELNDSTAQQAVSSKKKKNKKLDVVVIESDNEKSNVNFSNTMDDSSSSKKKKSKKNKENSTTNDHVTVPIETEIVEAPVSEKKKEKRTVSEMESTEQPYENESSSNDIPPRKKKKAQSLLIDLTDDNNASVEYNVEEQKEEDTVSQAAEATNPEEKRSKKNKKKNKSTNDPTPLVEVSPPNDLNPSTGPCLPDIYNISTFCAEKFRNVELPRFHDSNISEINGYGLSENLQLNIITIKTDQERIMRLWNGTLNKYAHATPKRKIYNTYVTKVKQARQNKSRIPNIKVKALKRQHVFQGL